MTEPLIEQGVRRALILDRIALDRHDSAHRFSIERRADRKVKFQQDSL